MRSTPPPARPTASTCPEGRAATGSSDCRRMEIGCAGSTERKPLSSTRERSRSFRRRRPGPLPPPLVATTAGAARAAAGWRSGPSSCCSPRPARRSPSDGGGQLGTDDQAGLRRGHHLALEHRAERGAGFRYAQSAQVRLAKIAVFAGNAARLGCHSQISPWMAIPVTVPERRSLCRRRRRCPALPRLNCR